MKKALSTLVLVSVMAFLSYGCDICTDSGGSVSNASNTKLYYQCDISAPTAATTISSGYTQTLGDIEWLSERIAEDGYVVLGLTPSNTYGNVSQWRDMHKSGIARLKEINQTHSDLRGMIDTSKLQVSGHSKGGGGSLWASAQLGGELATTIAMAPYQEQFSDSALGTITAATLIQAGGGDTLATNSMTRGEYSALPGNISKAYFEYSGLSHMSWTTGGSSSEQDKISGGYIAWMKYYLDCEDSYADTLSDDSGTARHEWQDLGNCGTPPATPTPEPGPCD